MLLTHQYQDGLYCMAVGPHAFATAGSEKFLSLNIRIELTGPYAVRENGRLFDTGEIHKFLTDNYVFSSLPPALLVIDIARELAARLREETDAESDPRVDLLSELEIELTLGDLTTRFAWNKSWDSESQLLDAPSEAFPSDLKWVRMLEIEAAKRDGMKKGTIIVNGSRLVSAKTGEPLPWEPKPEPSGAPTVADLTGWYNASIARAVAEIAGAEFGTAKWASVARNYMRVSHKDLGAPSTYIIGDQVVDSKLRAVVRTVARDEFSVGKATGWYVTDSHSFEDGLGIKLKDKLEVPADKLKGVEAARIYGQDYGNRLAFRRYNTYWSEHTSAADAAKAVKSTDKAAADKSPAHTGGGK